MGYMAALRRTRRYIFKQAPNRALPDSGDSSFSKSYRLSGKNHDVTQNNYFRRNEAVFEEHLTPPHTPIMDPPRAFFAPRHTLYTPDLTTFPLTPSHAPTFHLEPPSKIGPPLNHHSLPPPPLHRHSLALGR